MCVEFFFSSRRRHTRYWRDWSSDVCSSDLGILGTALIRSLQDEGGHAVRVVDNLTVGDREDLATAEIGRASCRERVQISVAAVSLKKKKPLCALLHTILEPIYTARDTDIFY